MSRQQERERLVARVSLTSGGLIMSITNIRKRQLKWEAIDSAFNRMEYWEELTGEDITDEERDYLQKAISSMAKHVGITNHINII